MGLSLTMHAKHKGSLAELLACAWLLKQGYEVFRNVSQHGKADLIVWRGNGLPQLVEVRTAVIRPRVDGKSCSVARASKSCHPDVRFLYVLTDTGECGFDLAELVETKGYTLVTAPPRRLVCSVKGCGQKHEARGFCNKHYLRWQLKIEDGASLVAQPQVAYFRNQFSQPAEHDC